MTAAARRETPVLYGVEDSKDDHAVYTENVKEDVEAGSVQGGGPLDIDEGFDKDEIRRVMRKVDWRLIPILSAMYAVSLVDRNNMALAKQANDQAMHKELGFNIGNRYTICVLVFFFPYILCEVPSQLGLRKFGARWWLGLAVTAWGLVMLGMGFIRHWWELAVLRVLLGGLESVLFPGAVYLINCWYPRRNMAIRNMFFYNTSTVISGFAGIFTYGVSQMDGTANYHGWQWILILCGIITIVVGVCGVLFIVDFPDRAKFLTDEERRLITTRIERDRADSVHDPLTVHKMLHYAGDFKIWIFGYSFCAAAMGAYTLAYFQPRILAELGFNNALAQVLVCPPAVFCFLQTFVCSKLADKFGWRMQMVAFNAIELLVGTVLYSQLDHKRLAGRYVGVVMAFAGGYGGVPLIVSWSQTSIRAQSKRAFTSAVVVAMGAIGGIIAAVAFKESEAAKGYPTGVFLTVALNIIELILITILYIWFKYQNRRADRGLVIIEGDEGFRYR